MINLREFMTFSPDLLVVLIISLHDHFLLSLHFNFHVNTPRYQ